DVAKLKMCVGKIVFFSKKFLERIDGGLKIVALDCGASLIEQFIQRIADGAMSALRRRLCFFRRGRLSGKRKSGGGSAKSDEAQTTGHVFAGELGFPLERLPEVSAPLDALFGGRFACPLALLVWPFAARILAR